MHSLQITKKQVLDFLRPTNPIPKNALCVFPFPFPTFVNRNNFGLGTVIVDDSGTDIQRILRGTPSVVCERITGTQYRNTSLVKFTTRFKKEGSPTGNVNAKIRKTSDNSVVSTANETVSISTIPTTETDYTWNFTGATTPNESFYLTVESSSYGGTPQTDFVDVVSNTSGSFADGTLFYGDIGSLSELTGSDVRMTITFG